MLDAQAKIITRFCDSIRTFMPLVVYQNDSLSVGFSDTVLFKYSMKYFGELSYTRKECEKVTFDLNNQYHSFIVLSLPKADIDNATLKVFSDFLNYMVDLSYQNPHDSIVVEETDEEELTK